MTRLRAGLAAGLAILAGGLLYTQQAPPAPQPTCPALLAEVKGLRAAMEQMASAGPRVQLFTWRIQLQETRISNMIRRLDAVHDALGPLQQDLATSEGAQKRVEERLASGTLAEKGPLRAEFTMELPVRKRQVVGLKERVSKLAAEEMQLTADLAIEQARWTDINARLDELERALSKR